MAISSFDGRYAFLSNFYPATVFYENRKYPSAEHAFQAAKTQIYEEMIAIQNAETPGRAKRLGRKCTLRPDWELIKDDVMYKIVRDKFTRHPDLSAALLNTGNAELIEGNTWNDCYWGVCDGEGQNHLGQILMKVRNELPYILH